MKLTFLGAAHEVTGSCTLLEACGRRILIDCGMEQGADIYENQEIPVSAKDIDCVLLTHAHMDHTGRLPLLYKNGFAGDTYATDATCDLCNIMLRDSAHIQEYEAEWKNRKGKRAGDNAVEPLYTMDDAECAIEHLSAQGYGRIIELFDGIQIRFTDVGHLLGSSSIEVFVTEDGKKTKIVFSGDIGNLDQPIIKNPTYISEADYVVIESTYGDRLHTVPPDYVTALAEIIQRTFDRGGNVVIPSFAVGRTQEMLYFMRRIKAEKLIKGHDGFPVYLDSPLAIEATSIFRDYSDECYDEETMALVKKGINPIGFKDFVTAVTADESKLINENKVCKVIISASGMCEAGRVKHHLKHNLWRPESTVLFVGYQANGTLGRALLEGADSVKLFGEKIKVKAEICRLDGVSGHADCDGLVEWASAFSPLPARFFVNHGEDEVCEAFTDLLREKLNARANAPYSGECWDLTENVLIEAGNRTRIEKKQVDVTRPSTPAYEALLKAGARLDGVIFRNAGGANKDLARFTEALNALCEQWDR